jgi:hypothetical protein
MRASVCVLAFALFFGAFAPRVAVAKTTAWINVLPGNWSDASNWSNGAPADGDDVVLGNNAGPLLHYADIPLALASLSITGNFRGLVQLQRPLSTGTLLIDAPMTMSLSTSSARLTVTGTTSILLGSIFTGPGVGGVAVDFQGDVTISGSGTFEGTGGGDTLVRSNLVLTQGGASHQRGGRHADLQWRSCATCVR